MLAAGRAALDRAFAFAVWEPSPIGYDALSDIYMAMDGARADRSRGSPRHHRRASALRRRKIRTATHA
jgi:hypothetical protein